MYIFCAVGAHCSSGMVMVVNPKTSGDVDKYKAAARGQRTTVPSTGVMGGVFNNPNLPGSGPVMITFLNPLVGKFTTPPFFFFFSFFLFACGSILSERPGGREN
jgi:hypothetical protein